MAQNREYQQSTVGQQNCSYSRLGSTYQGMSSTNNIGSGVYNVPRLCPNGPAPNYPPAYDTFSHGQQYVCGGYFNIKGAYPLADCENCGAQYVSRPCNDPISCGSAPAPAPAVVEKYSGCGGCGGR